MFSTVFFGFDLLFASGHRFAYQMVDLVARQLVQHVREANHMLPVPGRGSGIAKLSKPVVNLLASGPAAPAEESLSLTDDEADFSDLSLESALPLELEMELGDFEITPDGP